MLDQQKDWTLKLFLHNFFKENNLKNTLTSFENEVLPTSNLCDNLPIKSNKTFLLEWWNVFFYLYSEKTMRWFIEKNLLNSEETMKNLSFSELLKPGVLEMNKGWSFFNSMDMSNILSSNSFFLSTLESLSNISRSFNNINFPFNNANSSNFNLSTIQNTCDPFKNMNNINNLGNINSLLIKNNIHNVNNLPFQNDIGQINKFNVDSPLISVPNDLNSLSNIMKENKIASKLFNTTNTGDQKASQTKDFIVKKRKRYIKHNKLVYAHPASNAAKKMEKELEIEELIKDEDLLKAIEIPECINIDLNNPQKGNDQASSDPSTKGKKSRGSRFRGVSRNGNQWQVLIMVNKKKRYVASYSNEEEAARAYDKVALQNHGTKAKTNFEYADEEVKEILLEPPLLKINN